MLTDILVILAAMLILPLLGGLLCEGVDWLLTRAWRRLERTEKRTPRLSGGEHEPQGAE